MDPGVGDGNLHGAEPLLRVLLGEGPGLHRGLLGRNVDVPVRQLLPDLEAEDEGEREGEGDVHADDHGLDANNHRHDLGEHVVDEHCCSL